MNGHFEAKKHSYRQVQDGIVVSFVIHPNDVDAAFAVAPLGTRYMVGFAEIGDDGRPVAKAPVAKPAETKERRPFASLPLSQQAGIRCGDPDFQDWIFSFTTTPPEEYVRKYCEVDSRSELLAGTGPGLRWLALDARYQAHITDKKYSSVAR